MRILLVDDDAALAAMLVEYLAAESFTVESLADGEQAVRGALSGRYAAVILDVMMPGMSGIEILRQIRQSSRVPVIMLTAKGDDVDRVVGLELGADDYISKPFYSRELLARLKAVLRRTTSTEVHQPPAETVAIGDLVLRLSRREAVWRDRTLELTATEFKLLELLVRASGELVTKDALSEKALGRRRQPYDRSVDVHIGKVRQKLLATTSAAVRIETIRGLGYYIETAP